MSAKLLKFLLLSYYFLIPFSFYAVLRSQSDEFQTIEFQTSEFFNAEFQIDEILTAEFLILSPP